MATEEKQERDPSGYKTKCYRTFVGTYGVYVEGSLSCKPDYLRNSLAEAQNKARDKNFDERSHCYDYMYDMDPDRNRTKLTYVARELEIDECPIKILKGVARREGIEGFFTMKSKELKEILNPIIKHKKHRNQYVDIDMENCEFCQSGKGEAYNKKQDELDNDPVVIENRLFNNMYRQTMQNPMKESVAIKTHGLSKDDLKRGILAQKLHWQTRSFYGNNVTRYEYNDIMRYKKELQNETNEAKNDTNSMKKSKKRKLENVNEDEEAVKKRKVEDDDDVKEDENNIDYKGVPKRFQSFTWLYQDCDALDQDMYGRKKILCFLLGKYTRSDMETEDIELKRVESNDGKMKVVKQTVFRMLFAEKRWKKIIITKRINA